MFEFLALAKTNACKIISKLLTNTLFEDEYYKDEDMSAFNSMANEM